MHDRILLIDGHPDRDDARLCHALAGAYRDGCKSGGHEVRCIKVSEINFPLMRTSEQFESHQIPAAIKTACRIQRSLHSLGDMRAHRLS